MKRNCLTLLLLLSLSGFAQFQIGHITTTFTDASRNNRSIPVEIYYPSDTAGDNTPLTTVSGTFPILAFGHGFVMGWDAYEYLWTNLVPKGYIMVFPKTEGGIAPSHATFGADLAFVINRFNELNNDNTSVFYQRVAALNAVMGHSMGGGAALLAAQNNPEITALAVLAAAETNPSAIAAAANIAVPALVFAGANDCVTPPPANQLPMYDALSGTCKTYVSIIGASHCQMADSNFLCNLGEATCSPSATISRDAQHAIIDNYLGKWLDATLKDDCVAGAAFDNQIVADNAITYEKTCSLCAPLSVATAGSPLFEVGPNPFSTYLSVNSAKSDNFRLLVTDLSGKIVIDEKIPANQPINTGHLSQGAYLYTLTQSGLTLRSGKLVKR